MRLEELAEVIGAKVLNPEVAAGRAVERVWAGDRMSDLVTHATDATLVVTNIASSQLVRGVALMDASALCLLNGVLPEPQLVKAASESGAVVMVSPFDMFETCGRLYGCFRDQRRAAQ
jgi:hypothetical protein